MLSPRSNQRLERTRHERASLLNNLGEPLKRSVGLLPVMYGRDPDCEAEITFLRTDEGGRKAMHFPVIDRNSFMREKITLLFRNSLIKNEFILARQ